MVVYSAEGSQQIQLHQIRQVTMSMASIMLDRTFNTTTTTTTTILLLSGLCPSQPGWTGTRRNNHPLTPIMVINHSLSASSSSIFYDPWHPLFNLRAWQSLSTISLQVFFGLPLSLAPSTSYSVHFFTQSLSSFHSTCPCHRNLFCCSTKIMSPNPSMSLNHLLVTLSGHL